MELTGKKRTASDGKAQKIRQAGRLPAVVYGKNFEALSFSLNSHDFLKTYQEAGEATLVDLRLDQDTPIKVLIKDLQLDPVTNRATHADFYKVDLAEKVEATVPIEIVGEPEKVASGEAMVLTQLTEVTLKCLPLDLPSEIKVDISRLQDIGDTILVKDLSIDRSKIEIDSEDEELVLKLDFAEQLEIEEEEAEEAPSLEDIEVTREKEKGEGEEDPTAGKEEVQSSEAQEQK